MMKCMAVFMAVLAVAACATSSVANSTKQLTYGYQVGSRNGVSGGNLLKDGSGLVFRANPFSNVVRLYYVPTSADAQGQVVQISQEKVTTTTGREGSVTGFWISPDNSWVVYYGSNINFNGDPISFFSVAPTGGTITKISGIVPTASSNQLNARWKPDSARLMWYVLTVPSTTSSVNEIYSNTRDGANYVKLNQDLGQKATDPNNKRAVWAECSSSPDEGVLFSANPGATGLLDPQNLYVVNWDGTGLTMISPAVGNTARRGTGNQQVGRWTADRSYIVYAGNEEVDTVADLFSYNRATATRVKVSTAQAANGQIGCSNFQLTADSKSVVYTVVDTANPRNSLWSANLDGTNIVNLNTELVSRTNFYVTSDSKWVIYRVNVLQTAPLVNYVDLYASKIGVAGHKIKLNTVPLAGSSGVSAYSVQENPGFGNTTVVLFTQVTALTPGVITDLFVAALPAVDAASGANGALIAKLSAGLVSPGLAGGFSSGSSPTNGIRVTSDRKYVIYKARQVALSTVLGSVAQYQVFKVGIDGSQSQALLAPKTFSNSFETASTFAVSNFGDRYAVVFVTNTPPAPAAAIVNKIYSVTIEAGTEVVANISPVPTAGFVGVGGVGDAFFSSYEIHPNGQSVIYSMRFPDPSALGSQNAFWSISINGGDIVKISFDGFDPKLQGPNGVKTFLANGDILYIGNALLASVTDYFRNRSPAMIVAPAAALLVAALML